MRVKFERQSDVHLEGEQAQEKLARLDQLERDLAAEAAGKLVVLAEVQRFQDQIDEVRADLEGRVERADVLDEAVRKHGKGHDIRLASEFGGSNNTAGLTNPSRDIYAHERYATRENIRQLEEIIIHEVAHHNEAPLQIGLNDLPTAVRVETGLTEFPEEAARALCRRMGLPVLDDRTIIEGRVQEYTNGQIPGGAGGSLSAYNKMEVPAWEIACLEAKRCLKVDLRELLRTDVDAFIVQFIRLGLILDQEGRGYIDAREGYDAAFETVAPEVEEHEQAGEVIQLDDVRERFRNRMDEATHIVEEPDAEELDELVGQHAVVVEFDPSARTHRGLGGWGGLGLGD